MRPRPKNGAQEYQAGGKLKEKTALVTGGDSGIGRAVAVLFAKEGADVVIGYLNEHEDAQKTRRPVEAAGRRCLLMPGDTSDETFCKQAIEKTVATLGKLNILVNNNAEQHPQESILDITSSQLEQTFRTNLFSYFYMSREAVRQMQSGDVIINTTSVTA
jgi:NAD(P)-dependent dehydrogenase (short-subunit alcohol dehydrogenase family)